MNARDSEIQAASVIMMAAAIMVAGQAVWAMSPGIQLAKFVISAILLMIALWTTFGRSGPAFLR